MRAFTAPSRFAGASKGQTPVLFCAMAEILVKGWYSGMAIDAQDTLGFSVLSGVRSVNEVFPLEKVNEAYERMISGKARFRVVLAMEN